MTTHQCVTFLVVTVKPQQSPESSICPTLEPGQVVGSRVSSSTLLRLTSTSAVRVRGSQHVEVTSSDVYEVQLGNFPELTQKVISQFLASSR